MSFDRDLREALQCLAGDPVADAARVLAALPVKPPGPLPASRRPFLWLATAAVFAAGLVLGWLCGPPPPSTQPSQVLGSLPIGSPSGTPSGASKPELPAKQPPEDVAGPLSEQIQFVALDRLEIDEPGEGVQQIKPGAYRARAGTRFTTGQGIVGVFAYASEARVRLATDTVATVEPQIVKLAAGKLWLHGRARPVQVSAELAQIEVAAAVTIVERRHDSLFVATLLGEVTVRCTTGEVVHLPAGQQLEIARDGAQRVAAIPFAAALNGWLVPLLLMERDDTELRQRAGAMVDAWLDGGQPEAAALELRRLGSHAVLGLLKNLDQLEPARRAQAAALIADLADFHQREWLFGMLADGDAEVRGAAWRALTRVTGIDVEDEDFWRAEPSREQGLARQRWRSRAH